MQYVSFIFFFCINANMMFLRKTYIMHLTHTHIHVCFFKEGIFLFSYFKKIKKLIYLIL